MLTDDKFRVREQVALEESFKPFLKKKLIFIKMDEEIRVVEIERCVNSKSLFEIEEKRT